MRAAADAARAGTLSSCAGAPANASLQTLTLPLQDSYTTNDDTWTGTITCRRFCTYVARVENTETGETVLKTEADVPPAVEVHDRVPAAEAAEGHLPDLRPRLAVGPRRHDRPAVQPDLRGRSAEAAASAHRGVASPP